MGATLTAPDFFTGRRFAAGPSTAPACALTWPLAAASTRRNSSRSGTRLARAQTVHYNSAVQPHRRAPDRPGVRLKPNWARTDGGEAGLHPSNIHDNAYAIGSIDFTGDMPVILGTGRPKPGRLRLPGGDRIGRPVEDGPAQTGDTVRFIRVTPRRRRRNARSAGSEL
jgi:hypothetical protein